VRGKVGETNGKPLPYANVLLLKDNDSTLVKGAVTAENGSFSIENVKQGTYLVAVSMIGYKKTYSAIFTLWEENSQHTLPLLTVAPEDRQLDEVKVTAQKPLFEQQIDKLIVNVGNTLTAAGSTALDVLERSPGVVVNRQNNALSMSGKNGVLVMINGKTSRLPVDAVLGMLQGMQASNIEKIELITNPSSSYDAEGDAGIINIIVRKTTDTGTNGTISLTMGHGYYEKPSASINLNHHFCGVLIA
jgi:outer membrane receptor protein involved in Fe transport